MSRFVVFIALAATALAFAPLPVTADEPPAGGTGGSSVQFAGRTGATKAKLILEGGGNDSSERAVALGLRWLARQQQNDGSWTFDGDEKTDTAGATGLALLPFLGASQKHKSLKEEDEDNRYAKTVAAGLEFLKKACPKDEADAGKFKGATPTGQALAALALCEAYGMTRDADLKSYAQAAVNYLQKQQAKNGGWAEKAGAPSDIATTGWHLQALFAARQAKEVVDAEVVKNAVAFIGSLSAGRRKAEYGTTDSTDAKPGTLATATGLWCRYHFDAWGPNHPGLIEGVSGLSKNAPSQNNRDPLYLYYGTWNVARFEGEAWKDWNEGPKVADGTRKGGARDLLTSAQIKKPDDIPKHGSWDAEGEWGKRYGKLGTTALNVLTLEVYYRYLPLYKRGSDGPLKIDDK